MNNQVVIVGDDTGLIKCNFYSVIEKNQEIKHIGTQARGESVRSLCFYNDSFLVARRNGKIETFNSAGDFVEIQN